MRGDLIGNVQLAVSEATTNAVRHPGCTHFEIDGRARASSLIISVCDHGPGAESADAGLGLGLQIIAKLAESVDVEDTQPARCLTMRFDRHAYHGHT